MINLAEKYIPKAAETESINGREVVSVYTDAEQEYRAIRNESGMIDYSTFTVMQVLGDGASEYLDRLCTKDIRFLNIDMLAECLMMNDAGEALGVAWVLHPGDDYTVILSPESADEIICLMKEKLPAEGVMLTEITDQAMIGIEGRYTWRIIRDVLDVDVNGIPLRGILEVTDVAGGKITLARIGRSGEYGYLTLGDPETIGRYAEACFRYAESEGLKIQFVGSKAMEICMLETGQPNFRYENRTQGNVFELGQQWMIQFEKEEYDGRKKLMEQFEAGQDKACVLFVCPVDGAAVADGDPVWLEDEEAGKVIHAVRSPGRGKTVGIALVKTMLAVSGITLSAGRDKTVIETVSSPVIRPKSWDERMEE